jgi:hypothetical protein
MAASNKKKTVKVALSIGKGYGSDSGTSLGWLTLCKGAGALSLFEQAWVGLLFINTRQAGLAKIFCRQLEPLGQVPVAASSGGLTRGAQSSLQGKVFPGSSALDFFT